MEESQRIERWVGDVGGKALRASSLPGPSDVQLRPSIGKCLGWSTADSNFAVRATKATEWYEKTSAIPRLRLFRQACIATHVHVQCFPSRVLIFSQVLAHPGSDLSPVQYSRISGPISDWRYSSISQQPSQPHCWPGRVNGRRPACRPVSTNCLSVSQSEYTMN